MNGEFLHTCLITQDTTFRTLTAGVDGKDSEFAAFLLQHMDAKGIDGSRLASPWHATDTHTDRVTAIGQTLVDDLLRFRLMGQG